jgi:hypothetical protein
MTVEKKSPRRVEDRGAREAKKQNKDKRERK